MKLNTYEVRFSYTKLRAQVTLNDDTVIECNMRFSGGHRFHNIALMDGPEGTPEGYHGIKFMPDGTMVSRYYRPPFKSVKLLKP